MSGTEWEKRGEEMEREEKEDEGWKGGERSTCRELIGCGGCGSNCISREGAGNLMSNIGYR